MGIRLGAVLVLVACGTPKGATGPQPDLDNMKMYEPFAMRDDAKQPHQAIILGTDAKGGSTVLKLPAAPSEAITDAMGVRVKLATSPNPDGKVNVGIYEEKVGANASQWRAGVWVSALVAANTLGKDLTDFTFSASSGGDIDGPSASALITAGFLATITGAKLDPTATLTGTINVDGTIGPVGGVVEKFDAALAKGMKKIGYPSGMRIAHVGAKVFDLVEHAKARGATAIEVTDVYEAYKLLTGKPLPSPIPVAAAEMAIDATTNDAIDVKIAHWQREVAAKSAALAQVRKASALPQTLSEIVKAADQTTKRVEALKSQSPAAAYAWSAGAWIYTKAAIETHDALTKIRAGDLAGARAALPNPQIDAGKSLQVIAELRPTTIGGHILMMGAFQSALRGSGFAVLALHYGQLLDEHLRTLEGKSKTELASPAVADGAVAAIVPYVMLHARSVADSTVGTQRLEIENAKSMAYMCSIPNVRRLATSFRSASTAGMSYLDALLVEPRANQWGVSTDVARMRIATTEPDYLVSYALAHLDSTGQEIKDVLGESSLAWNIMLLAGAERGHLDAAQLSTKYYALDEAKYSATSDREAVLAKMLDHAERTARANARAALVATGAIPIQAKINYQIASAYRGGDFAERLEALVAFWSASTYSQTAVMLARN
jgi:hypothetical protein